MSESFKPLFYGRSRITSSLQKEYLRAFYRAIQAHLKGLFCLIGMFVGLRGEKRFKSGF
jgi:hypothetical protein